jgi:hypothetical protein
MYEDGSLIKIVVEVGEDGLKELEFVGRVVVDGSDFMAIQFDTLIIPKSEIKSADPIPEDKKLEDILGAEKEGVGVERPAPPKVDNVRFLPQEPEKPKQKPQKRPGQKPPAGQAPPKK